MTAEWTVDIDWTVWGVPFRFEYGHRFFVVSILCLHICRWDRSKVRDL